MNPNVWITNGVHQLVGISDSDVKSVLIQDASQKLK